MKRLISRLLKFIRTKRVSWEEYEKDVRLYQEKEIVQIPFQTFSHDICEEKPIGEVIKARVQNLQKREWRDGIVTLQSSTSPLV